MDLFFSHEDDDPNHEDEESIDYTPSAPPLEQLRPLKRQAPSHPNISQVLLVPPVKFLDLTRETLVHSTMVMARTS